jgi:glycerol-3-phosphate acyltransferase PlsX
MGAVYAREVLGSANPRVGLMNIGSEDGKGNELVRETHALLSKGPVKDNYIGSVEGRGLYQGEADVLVCEGFVGNVVLKVSEGMAEMMLRKVAQHVLEQLNGERQLAGEVFDSLGKRYSYHESGGAPLLGVDGICMICHGSSNGRSIYNALRGAVAFQNRRINPQIVAELAAAQVDA